MDIKTLVNATSKAWSLPILRLLHSGVPGRQAMLLAASGASRTAFVQSLTHLVDTGMVERNPGHGHPLRPEYRLTANGIRVAAVANRVLECVDPRDQPIIRRAWTVPILVSLHTPCRYNQIKMVLPKITDRALSQSLKSMESLEWVRRDVDGAVRPPRSLYRAVNTGDEISQAVNIALQGS